MFQGLRENSLIYILDKGEKPELKTGQVVRVSNPMPKFGTTPMYGQTMETTVDVTVKIDNEQMELKQLPSTLSIANSGHMVVSENKEAMCGEVESMLRQSKAIVESVNFHKDVISACEGMLAQLNPQIAKEKEQQERIAQLESKVVGMDSTLADIKGMLSEALKK